MPTAFQWLINVIKISVAKNATSWTLFFKAKSAGVSDIMMNVCISKSVGGFFQMLPHICYNLLDK